MKQAKVRKHTVGFFRNDAEVPFINLEMFETITAATQISQKSSQLMAMASTAPTTMANGMMR